MRGGKTGPNYAVQFIRDAGAQLAKALLPQKIMVSTMFHVERKKKVFILPLD